jgi:uncharacterized protein DUF6520
MKKIKLAIMVTAILLSVGGAFATKLNQACAGAPQYYWNGAGMIPAGVMGWDYYCAHDNGSTCTYYQVAGGYAACQLGVWIMIQH